MARNHTPGGAWGGRWQGVLAVSYGTLVRGNMGMRLIVRASLFLRRHHFYGLGAAGNGPGVGRIRRTVLPSGAIRKSDAGGWSGQKPRTGCHKLLGGSSA